MMNLLTEVILGEIELYLLALRILRVAYGRQIEKCSIIVVGLFIVTFC